MFWPKRPDGGPFRPKHVVENIRITDCVAPVFIVILIVKKHYGNDLS